MAESPSDKSPRRLLGKVARVGRDFGFICAEDIDDDLYFNRTWFRGSPPLREGEEVTFELKVVEGNHQAHFVRRAGTARPEFAPDGLPTGGWLFDWAFLGYIPKTLGQLKTLALDEQWEFSHSPSDPERPYPILHSYLVRTFERLVLERKIMVSPNKRFAAFNTGLVDPRYETIYALFSPNDDGRTPWQLAGFCNAGEGVDGQNLVRHFSPLPAAAHYFDAPADLLYDARTGKPELDWKHVVIDRIERYPEEFLLDHWPNGFPSVDVSGFSLDERRTYYEDFGKALESDSRMYRRIMNRVKDAVDLSIKRVSWNFKTAVPQYYPTVRHLQLLLPVCLVRDDQVDMALAVEKTESGNYLGHTVLPLDWAYRNARLICRPDSDWLEPGEIVEGTPEDAED